VSSSEYKGRHGSPIEERNEKKGKGDWTSDKQMDMKIARQLETHLS
jgi:hypothetical protein